MDTNKHTPRADDIDTLLTTEVARQRLSLSRSTFESLLNRGCITYVRIGRVRRIRLTELQRFINQLDNSDRGQS